MFIFIVIISFLIILCFGYLIWMDEQIYNPPEIPETELEKRARSIKYRLKDADRLLHKY